jgi:hypothetical protein
MNTPPDFSPDQSAYRAPSRASYLGGIEWGAVFTALIAGAAWIAGTKFIYAFLNQLMFSTSASGAVRGDWVAWGYMAVAVAVSLAKGTTVGFVAGFRARGRPYLSILIVMPLLFALSLTINLYIHRRLPLLFSPRFFLTMVLYEALGLAAALNGAYLAQSVRRNRGVRIQ